MFPRIIVSSEHAVRIDTRTMGFLPFYPTHLISTCAFSEAGADIVEMQHSEKPKGTICTADYGWQRLFA